MLSSIQLSNWTISLAIGATSQSVITPKQIHGSTIIPAASCIPNTSHADGLVANYPHAPFGIHTADCMPLALATPSRAFALHISRHTIVAGILNTVMKLLVGEPIIGAYIGPHICETCFTFETKGEGIVQLERLHPNAVRMSGSVSHVSLLDVIIPFLRDQGLDVTRVVQDGRCTFEDSQLPSYKQWLIKGKTGKLQRITLIVS